MDLSSIHPNSDGDSAIGVCQPHPTTQFGGHAITMRASVQGGRTHAFD